MEETQEHRKRAFASKVNFEHISALVKNAVGIKGDNDNMAYDCKNYYEIM